MSLKDRLIPIIQKSGLEIGEISSLMGLSVHYFYKKIEQDNLTVKDAFELCRLLNIENPSEVFFNKI